MINVNCEETPPPQEPTKVPVPSATLGLLTLGTSSRSLGTSSPTKAAQTNTEAESQLM
ncbi:hypothetical protein [Microseira sp. BLCC-F43]|uniref:hypothetical protein n=1 Tax=Microseira sp. BLCC-F43 TaxID=3153602 RepID=UPI0035BA4322